MRQQKFTSEQITELLKNKYIIKCSSKNITYGKEFKVFAVKRYAEGVTPKQIFNESSITSDLVGNNTPGQCLKRWRRKFKVKGEAGLLTEERGRATGSQRGRPKTNGLSDAERIKRLEIENAYLKAKNDFLVKLRAQEKS